MVEQHRRPVASYKTYREAERAVDLLSGHGIPVARVTITVQDVRLVEQVIGPMDYGRAALHGTASGALPGVLIGWLFGHANWFDPVVSALYGLIFGAVGGALFGMPLHALQSRRRAFASLRPMQRAGTRSSWTRRSPTGLCGRSARCGPPAEVPSVPERT